MAKLQTCSWETFARAGLVHGMQVAAWRHGQARHLHGAGAVSKSAGL